MKIFPKIYNSGNIKINIKVIRTVTNNKMKVAIKAVVRIVFT